MHTEIWNILHHVHVIFQRCCLILFFLLFSYVWYKLNVTLLKKTRNFESFLMNFYQRSPSVDKGSFCWTDTKEGEGCGTTVLSGGVRLNIPHYPIIRVSSISTSMVVMTFLFSILYVILYRLFTIVHDYRMHWDSVHHSPCVIRWSSRQGSSPSCPYYIWFCICHD